MTRRLILVLATVGCSAQTLPVVNAASFSGGVAPDAIASAFGPDLAAAFAIGGSNGSSINQVYRPSQVGR